ncbi:hypothetical protein [Helicobacter rodentium]|uniref:hypothetical protein n=1 Tax=Helicobacter rodentium TaxID=59617 RepID=UPI002352A8DF|nr:hypothetical protein [Helicobacter rodentium]
MRDEAIYNLAYLIAFTMESQNTKITSKILYYRFALKRVNLLFANAHQDFGQSLAMTQWLAFLCACCIALRFLRFQNIL